MRFSRRANAKSAGLVAVALLAVVAMVLIILKFKDSGQGPGVTAVPLTGTQPQRANNDTATANKTGATPAAAKKAATPQADRDMEIQVIDATSKQPLEGVELSITMQPGGQRKDRTETKGKAWLMLPPEDPKYLSISAKLPGYVGRHIDLRGKPIPETQLIEMEKGTSIGGIVKDEDGNPIRGAGVSLLFPGDPKAAGRGMYMTEGPFRTDGEGKWRCDAVPADLANLSMKLDHPDFISDESYGANPKPADAELRGMTAVSVMKRGLALEGVVTDLQGKPIAGASIAQGADRFGSNQPKVRTDAEGKFAFKNSRPGPVVLTVMAKTYAPELKSVTVAKGIAPVEIKLAPGNVVKGKVVDRNGKPVSGAFVAADTWRGNRSLEWRVNTKADGTFVWKEAPADDVLVHLGKQGFQSKRDLHVTPSETEILVTLQPPQKIHGSVTDSQTGAPISSFTVIQGLGWNVPNPGTELQINWQRDWNSLAGKDGQYEMTFDEPYPFRALRIEAPGYMPAVSTAYKPEDVDITFDAKLVKGTGPAGIVKNPDGTPAADVDLVLATASTGTGMYNGVLDNRRSGGNAPMAKSKEDGKFEFSPQTEPYMLIVAGPGGYATAKQADFEKSKEVKLEPWGKVSGTLKIGSKIGANEPITMSFNTPYDPKAPRFYAQYETRTDKDGNFTFDRVTPGEGWVSRQVMIRTGRYMQGNNTHSERFTLKSGESVSVQLGGKGRPVIGKVVLPKEGVAAGWTLQGGMNTKQPEPQYPKDYAQWTPEKQQEWMNTYYKSDEYKQLTKNTKYYNFHAEADGSFRLEDVMPGTYHLYASANEQTSQFQEQVAMAQSDVTMPPIPGGQSDEPLDVGTLQLSVMKRIKVGDDMSTYTTLKEDGKPFQMADYKGKVLVVHMWESTQDTNSKEAVAMKEIFDAYGKNEKFVLLGLCFDQKPEIGKAYAQKNGMTWPQVYLGGKSNIYQEWGLRMFPTTLVIGADGKLVARDVQRPQLKPLIDAALKK